MTEETAKLRKTSNAYSIFHPRPHRPVSGSDGRNADAPIGRNPPRCFRVYDNLICVIFLIDFFLNLRGGSQKSDYFHQPARLARLNWLDPLVRDIEKSAASCDWPA